MEKEQEDKDEFIKEAVNGKCPVCGQTTIDGYSSTLDSCDYCN